MMLPHLQEEEDVGLPLYRAYFTQQDAAPLIKELVDNSPKYELGSIIYFDGVERFRTVFMPQESIPFFVWYIAFSAKYKSFVKDVVEPVTALRKGEEPKAEGLSCVVL
jgi:hypothetical protein